MRGLIARGWDPQLRDHKGWTPADYALSCNAEQPRCKEVQEILNNPTEVLTCMQLKQLFNSENCVNGGNINTTALKSMVPSEVSPNAFHLNAHFEDLIPLLSLVIRQHECNDESHAAIQYLVDQGANAANVSWDFHYFPDEVSPIIMAAIKKDLKVIKILEKAGADLNRIEYSGYSVLSIAIASRGSLAQTEPLVEYLLRNTNIGKKGTTLSMFCLLLYAIKYL